MAARSIVSQGGGSTEASTAARKAPDDERPARKHPSEAPLAWEESARGHWTNMLRGGCCSAKTWQLRVHFWWVHDL